jgi:hypothetical protein
LAGTADFNGDGDPDYVLYNDNTRQTAIWYLKQQRFHPRRVGPNSSCWLELIPGYMQPMGLWLPVNAAHPARGNSEAKIRVIRNQKSKRFLRRAE